MRASADARRPRALLVTPIPPMPTGLATYAVRVLEYTSQDVAWTVAFPPGGDPDLLPGGTDAVALEDLDPASVPPMRFFCLGNSPHCFDILGLLRRVGGAAVMHETVLHHMIRHCSLERGMWDDYLAALDFEYGPGAGGVRRKLGRRLSEEEYDALLKRYPLIGRAVHSSVMLLCLNCSAAEQLRRRAGTRPVLRIGHPLSPIPRTVPADPPGSPVIGMAGSFHPGRGLPQALEAVRSLRRSHPDACLVLAGGGWPETLPGWALTTGRLPEPEYQGWIRSFDVGLDVRHPSCGETSGSLLEVMRAGVPCVVSDSGGLACIPSDCVLRLPAEGLGHTLPRALERLLSRDGAEAGMGERGRAWAEAEGSPARAVEDWRKALSLYPGARRRLTPRPSLAAAWSPLPGGAQLRKGGDAVEWLVEDTLEIQGPDWAEGAWVSAAGEGDVNGAALPSERSVLRVAGGRLVFTGPARVTAVTWLGGGDG